MERRRKPGVSVDTLVRDLYGSLSEETRLEESLHRVGAAFRSHISGLHTEDFGAHRGRLTLVGNVTAEDYRQFTDSYSSRWTGQNLWMERSLDGFLRQGFQSGDAVVTDAELRASAYYEHFLKPLDIRHGLGICIWNDDRMNMAVASFHRGHGDVGYDADDIAMIHRIRPHLANAYAIHRRFAKLQGDHLSIRMSFDRAPLGMMVLDADARVLECNANADRLLRSGLGLARGADARLSFASPASRQAMYKAVARLVASSAPLPESLLIATGSCESAARSLVLHLCAFPHGMGGNLHVRGRILGFLAEMRPQQREAFNVQILQQTLGLTRAEARAALALREHADVGAAAQTLGIAPATVRSQLKSIFRKLGMHQYGELLLVVERLVTNAPC